MNDEQSKVDEKNNKKIILAFLSKYLCFCFKKKLDNINGGNDNEEVLKLIERSRFDRMVHNRSSKRKTDTISKGSQEHAADNELLWALKRKEAATEIQKAIRSYLAKKTRDKLWRDAMNSSRIYWKNIHDQILLEKRKSCSLQVCEMECSP